MFLRHIKKFLLVTAFLAGGLVLAINYSARADHDGPRLLEVGEAVNVILFCLSEEGAREMSAVMAEFGDPGVKELIGSPTSDCFYAFLGPIQVWVAELLWEVTWPDGRVIQFYLTVDREGVPAWTWGLSPAGKVDPASYREAYIPIFVDGGGGTGPYS